MVYLSLRLWPRIAEISEVRTFSRVCPTGFLSHPSLPLSSYPPSSTIMQRLSTTARAAVSSRMFSSSASSMSKVAVLGAAGQYSNHSLTRRANSDLATFHVSFNLKPNLCTTCTATRHGGPYVAMKISDYRWNWPASLPPAQGRAFSLLIEPVRYPWSSWCCRRCQPC